MEATVDKLETMFQKADADLDYLSRKMDFEFMADQDGQSGAIGGKPNPAKMLQKISEIKKEYAEIVKEAEAIKNAQKEAMDFFRTELMMVCETLGRLQQNVGMEQAPRPEEMARVTEILGIEMPPCTGGEDGASLVEPEEEEEPRQTQDPAEISKAPGRQRTLAEGAQPQEQCLPSPPTDLRAKGTEFVEVTEDEFQSVSTLVRDRSKLTEINQTYRILWTHFKEQGNKNALTPQDMHKMNLHVTGKTGEAKLKVLRALKLLILSSKGDVQLV